MDNELIQDEFREIGHALHIKRTKQGINIYQLSQYLRELGIEVYPDHIKCMELGYVKDKQAMYQVMAKLDERAGNGS